MIKIILFTSIMLNMTLIIRRTEALRKIPLPYLEERQAVIEELTRLQFENHNLILKVNRMEKFIDNLLNERDHKETKLKGDYNG